MNTVGAQSYILKTSNDLRSCLERAGKNERLSAGEVLFQEDGENAGVFLLLRGKIRMSVKGLPNLDRIFSAGSLLGLPSSFTGRPYSLTGLALTDAVVTHVAQDIFLQIMRDRPELCREATEILGREVTFIQSALTERRRQGLRRTAADGAVLAQ